MSQTAIKTKIIHLNEANFAEKALRAEGPTLVDFYADWCGPCRALGSILEEFAAENPSVKVVKVNVDENPRLAADFRVSSIPHLVVIKNGRVTAQHSGIAEKTKIKTLVTR